MARSTQYFDLRDALTQPSCPICRLVDSGVRQFVDGLFYESLTVVERRAEIREARGFCSAHSSVISGTTRVLGSAIIHRDVINDVLRGIPEANAPKGLFRQGVAAVTDAVVKAIKPRRECPLCEFERRQEKILLETLLRNLHEPELREAFERSAGLCLPHLQTVCGMRGIQDDNLRWLIETQRSILLNLRDQLDLFVHRYNGSYDFAQMGSEAEAPQRAVRTVSGRIVARRG
jgi:Family of unknown function (DUF6062)